MKTKTDSYLTTKLPCKGCQLCLKGQKLVLFVGGSCSRNCWYCSLSEGRKNSPQTWANERPINSTKDLIQEALESNAKGAGITGGDPLVYLDKTIKYAKALKQKFGKSFHIHIYLPFPLVDKKSIQKLKTCVDEIRFHASFLIDNSNYDEELEKLRLSSEIFDKENTGIELPLIPEKKKELIKYITDASPFISFCNLNEFELSDTNFKIIESSYTLSSDTYTIHNSLETGKQILKHFTKSSHRRQPISKRSDLTGDSRSQSEAISIHLCTARTKNLHQYANRLKLHKILPYGIKTKEGTVVYIEIPNPNKQTTKDLKKYTKKFHLDSPRNRILLDQSEAQKIFKTKLFNLHLSEEHPTFDAEKMSYWKLSNEDFE